MVSDGSSLWPRTQPPVLREGPRAPYSAPADLAGGASRRGKQGQVETAAPGTRSQRRRLGGALAKPPAASSRPRTRTPSAPRVDTRTTPPAVSPTAFTTTSVAATFTPSTVAPAALPAAAEPTTTLPTTALAATT